METGVGSYSVLNLLAKPYGLWVPCSSEKSLSVTSLVLLLEIYIALISVNPTTIC